MKNIFNLIKYDLKENWLKYTVQAVIIFLVMIGFDRLMAFVGNQISDYSIDFNIANQVPFTNFSISTLKDSTVQAIGVAILSINLIIAFITEIVKFSNGLSKEKGNLLFTTTVKGWEYLIFCYVRFMLQFIALTFIVALGNLILTGSVGSLVLYSALGLFAGFGYIFIGITINASIISSFVRSNAIAVIGTIIALLFESKLFSLISYGITRIFGDVYIAINEKIFISILPVVLGLAVYTIGFIVSSKLIDKKLDIY